MKKTKYLKKFAKNFVVVRNAYNYSQDALAEIAGVHRTQIYRIEAGLSDPRGETVARIAKAIGADLKEFYDFDISKD